jgi:hypothetical protein
MTDGPVQNPENRGATAFRGRTGWRRQRRSGYCRAVAQEGRHRSRTRLLAERRPSLVRLLIALFVARIAVTVTEIAESRVLGWSALITAVIGIEAWRAWSVRRDARRDPSAASHAEPVPDSVWDRVLRPLERHAPLALYVLSALYLAAFLALLVAGEPRDVLLDVAVIAREAITVFFLLVIVAAYRSIRPPRPRAAPDTAPPG